MRASENCLGIKGAKLNPERPRGSMAIAHLELIVITSVLPPLFRNFHTV